MTAAIVVDNLIKRYGNLEAVAGISFSVPKGSIFGLLGRNGAGKTTTLECCIGLKEPTSGSVRVLGLDPSRRSELARLRRLVGVQLQTVSLPEKASIGEMLELNAAYYSIPARVQEMVNRVGLEGKLDRQVAHMSGGEQQRLALALALQPDPEVLFLDEPSAGMDAFGRRILWSEIERLRDAGKTVVLTTHYIEEAARLCERLVIMDEGRIVTEGTPNELIAEHAAHDVLEVTGRDAAALESVALDGLIRRRERHGETLYLYNADNRSLLRRFSELGVEPERHVARQATLEDVFLNITGRELTE